MQKQDIWAMLTLIILLAMLALFVFVAYKILMCVIKKAIDYKLEKEHNYRTYYQAEQDINDIEWDMKNHQEDKP